MRQIRVRWALGWIVGAACAWGQVITTAVGTDWVFPASVASAVNAPLGSIEDTTVDAKGNVFVADSDNNMVMRISPDGTATVIAGNGLGVPPFTDTSSYTNLFSGDGGPAASASLYYPSAVAVDAAGSVYIADSANHRVRRVTPDGAIATIAGNGTPGFSGDGGPATGASLKYPNSLAVDSAGNLYIADYSNNRVRKVTSDGKITTIAGNGTAAFSGDGGPATAASLWGPARLALDRSGNLYISDYNEGRVRRVSTAGTITTFAGNGTYGFSGDGGPAGSAAFRNPEGLVFDPAGNLYVSDKNNHRVRKIAPNGIISTVAGNSGPGFSGDGGPAASALLNGPQGLALDGAGNLYIADTSNSRLRRVTPVGRIDTLAGNASYRFSGDGGPAASAVLNAPRGLAFDAGGNLYFADEYNGRVRKRASDGAVTTVAGSGLRTKPGDGDGGPATRASLATPAGLTFDAAGSLYIVDNTFEQVRKVEPNGTITTVAGNGSSAFSGDGGAATAAGLDPDAVAVDSGGNLYIADTNNRRIRKVSPDGKITTVAGGGQGGDGGPATSASLCYPSSIALDGAGNLYFAQTGDDGCNRIRKVATDGIITTFAGNGTAGSDGDGGPATSGDRRQYVRHGLSCGCRRKYLYSRLG